MPDLLMAAGLSDPAAHPGASRPLGSRGSREEVADQPTDLPQSAVAVLAGLVGWWRSRAASAGLTGKWLDIEYALQANPPTDVGDDSSPAADLSGLTPEGVGAAYVEALSSATRARYGRHYTPKELASRLWDLARTSMELPPATACFPDSCWIRHAVPPHCSYQRCENTCEPHSV